MPGVFDLFEAEDEEVEKDEGAYSGDVVLDEEQLDEDCSRKVEEMDRDDGPILTVEELRKKVAELADVAPAPGTGGEQLVVQIESDGSDFDGAPDGTSSSDGSNYAGDSDSDESERAKPPAKKANVAQGKPAAAKPPAG